MNEKKRDYRRLMSELVDEWRDEYCGTYGKDFTSLYVNAIDLFILWAEAKGYRMASYLTGDDYDTQQRIRKLSSDARGNK